MIKLKDSRGETLVETLAALLIIMFAMIFLTSSVISAVKVNAKMKNTDNSIHYSSADSSDGTITISVTGNTEIDDETVSADVFSENDYIYYQHIE